MSRRKQKFPVHLKNEQLERGVGGGGSSGTEAAAAAKTEKMSEDSSSSSSSSSSEEEFSSAKDVRVPVNGQVVTVPITSSSSSPSSASVAGAVGPGRVRVLPVVSFPLEGLTSSYQTAVKSGPSLSSSSSSSSSSPSPPSCSGGLVVGPVQTNLTTPLSVTLGTSHSSSCNPISNKSAKNRTGDPSSSSSAATAVTVPPYLVSSSSGNSGSSSSSSSSRSPQAFSNSAITLLTTVTSSANLKRVVQQQDPSSSTSSSSCGRERVSGGEDSGSKSSKLPVSVGGEFPYTCPVCQEPFKSKRSFNAHIIVHCQLVNGSSNGPKRSISSAGSPSPDKKRIRENVYNEQLESVQHGSKIPEEDTSLPLDLSCRGSLTSQEYVRPAASSTPENKESHSGSDSDCKGDHNPHLSSALHDASQPSTAHLNHSVLSDRGPLEDENENLVNEARERENSFFNTAQNEQYLTEDSTGLDPPPPLPLYGSGGAIRRIRVSSDDGPPMVYSVRLHAEQVLVSRILGVNEETGDKMELYKCFMCSVAFPSISRLQAHLTQHKQRFVCSKCSFSCDSRVQFSHHVQREHLSSVAQSRRDKVDVRNDMSDDSNSAENTVTVAALLSALREKAQENRPVNLAPKEPYDEDDDDHGSEDSCPISPSSESQEAGELQEGGSGEDLFKMYTCRFCGKKFDRAFSCNRHERVHTGYKPCFCRVCGRGFSEPRNLRHHVIRFHSDGSLRHLIKRDRRKKMEDDSPTPSVSPVPPKYPESRFKDVLKETANKLITSSNIDMTGLSGQANGLEITLAANIGNNHNNPDEGKKIAESKTPPLPVSSEVPKEPSPPDATSCVTTYTTNLTKIIAASLDNSTRGTRRSFIDSFRNDELEPGEIRLDRRTKIIDDGESGRRLVITDDQSEEGLDHSPHFSNYAPRLNIVQEPIDRDKALVPITDDIGRTFFECPYCHKLFGSTSDMNRHLDFHEDLRPYNCEYCDYSARTNSQLKVHKMRHEGIKLYSCDVCNYNGVTQSDLNRHKKTQSHIARSQNVCSMCGLGFYTASQKQVHVVQCHPEVEGASSLIQMSLGPPVAPLMTGSEFSSLSNSSPSTAAPPLPQATATAL